MRPVQQEVWHQLQRRHKSSQTFNRYRTIYGPAPQKTQSATAQQAIQKSKRWNPRYTHKERIRRIDIKRESPKGMKRYTTKPYKVRLQDSPVEPPKKPKPRKANRVNKPPMTLENMKK
ncbi:hypothetical protein BGZ65_010213, partial [Modicella reniformis]